MGEWQDISTAPKDGRRIDVWFELTPPHSARFPDVRWDKRRMRWAGGPADQGKLYWEATHWMPLPEAPK